MLQKMDLRSGHILRRLKVSHWLLLLLVGFGSAFASSVDNVLEDELPVVASQEQAPTSFSIGSLTFVLDVNFRSLKASLDDVLRTMLMFKLAHASYYYYPRTKWPGLANTLIQTLYTGWYSYLVVSSRLLFAGHCIDKGVTYLRKQLGNCALWQEIPVYIEDPQLARRVYLKVVNRRGEAALVFRVLSQPPAKEPATSQPESFRAWHQLADWLTAHSIHTMEVSIVPARDITGNPSAQLELTFNGRSGVRLPLPGSEVPRLRAPCQFGQEADSSLHTLLSPQWLDWIRTSLQKLDQPSLPTEQQKTVNPPLPGLVTRHGDYTTALRSGADEGNPYWVLFTNAEPPYIQITRSSSPLSDYPPSQSSALAAHRASQIVWRDQDVYDTFWSMQWLETLVNIRLTGDPKTLEWSTLETEDVRVASEITHVEQLPSPKQVQAWQIPAAQIAEARPRVVKPLPGRVPLALPLVTAPEPPPAQKAPIAPPASRSAIAHVKKEPGRTEYDFRFDNAAYAVSFMKEFLKDQNEEKIRASISMFVDIFLTVGMEVFKVLSPAVLEGLKHHKKNPHEKGVKKRVIAQTAGNIVTCLNAVNRLARLYKAVTSESVHKVTKGDSATEPLQAPFTMAMILFYMEWNYEYISTALRDLDDEDKIIKGLFNTATIIPLLLKAMNLLEEGQMSWQLNEDETARQAVDISESRKWQQNLPILAGFEQSDNENKQHILRALITWLGHTFYSHSLYQLLSNRPSLEIPENTMAELLSGLPAILRSSIKLGSDGYSHGAFALFNQMPAKGRAFLEDLIKNDQSFRDDFSSSLQAYLLYIDRRYHKKARDYTGGFIKQSYPDYFDEDIRRLDKLFAAEPLSSEVSAGQENWLSVLEAHRYRLYRLENKHQQGAKRPTDAQQRRFKRYLKSVSQEQEIRASIAKRQLEKARKAFFTLDTELETESVDEPATPQHPINLSAMDSPWENAMSKVTNTYRKKNFAQSIKSINNAIELSSDDEQFVLASYEKANLYANELLRQMKEAMAWRNKMQSYEKIVAKLDLDQVTALVDRSDLSTSERHNILAANKIQYTTHMDREEYSLNALRLHREISNGMAAWKDLVSEMLETVQGLNDKLELLPAKDSLRVEGGFVSKVMTQALENLNHLQQTPAIIKTTEEKTRVFVTALGVYGVYSNTKNRRPLPRKPYQRIDWMIPELTSVTTLIQHLTPSTQMPEPESVSASAVTITREPDITRPQRELKEPSKRDFGEEAFYLPKNIWWEL